MRRTRDLLRQAVALGLCCLFPLSSVLAQAPPIEPVRPEGPIYKRPYMAADVPPIRTTNSERLRALVRAGTLYLTAQDAIALALENNIDLELARYSPIMSAWRLERAEAGGALPGVPSGASQAGSVASGQGVAGSQAAAGVSGGGGGQSNAGTGNATISQIGPVTQNLDPSFSLTTSFSHKSAPQPNLVQSFTPNLITNTRTYVGSYQQGTLSGGSATLSFNEHYLNENSPSDVLNPSVAPSLALSVNHNLLRGFGRAMNARNITVSRLGLNISELSFKNTVISTVVRVLNAYYALVADFEDLRARQSSVDAAQTFRDENKRRVELGALAEIELTTADAQLAANQRDLILSQTNLQQHELQLKSLLGRTATADPLLAGVHIVPLDRIVVPEKDDLPALNAQVETALSSRSDLAIEKININGAEISSLGTKNGILPLLVVIGSMSQAGLAGSKNLPVANPDFIGGMGTALSQVFRRHFATESVGAFYQMKLGNRQAQADHGIDQLQLRQTQLTASRDQNQVQVDVMNARIAISQAKARLEAASQNRVLQQKLLEAEQQKFNLGASTPYNVIQQQRDVANAQSAVIAAMVAYSNARVALDQTLGTTLEANHITITEASAGVISKPSALPAELPAPPAK